MADREFHADALAVRQTILQARWCFVSLTNRLNVYGIQTTLSTSSAADVGHTFAVEVEAYFIGVDGRPSPLAVPALADGTTCFVGRNEKNDPELRLVMTEGCVDCIPEALAKLDEDEVAQQARQAFGHIRDSHDLRQLLSGGIDRKSVGKSDWTLISSLTG